MPTTRQSGRPAPPAAPDTERTEKAPVPKPRLPGLASLSTETTVFQRTVKRRQTSLHDHRRAVHADRAVRHPDSET